MSDNIDLLFASMEPRFFKRGNIVEQVKAEHKFVTLQWNHASSSVEIRLLLYNFLGKASCFNGTTLLQAWK